MKVSQARKCQERRKFLQVQSQKPSSAMMKLALMRIATGNEDPELALLHRISSLELPASEIAAQINASQSSSNRHISTLIVHKRLHDSGLDGWTAAKKPLLKDTNNKKRLAWDKKHEQWTLDRWKSVLWADESKCEMFGSNHCLCEMQSRWTFDLCRCGSHREAWRRRRCDGVWFPQRSIEEEVCGCFAGDTICDLFRNQGTLNQHGYHSILQRYAISSGLHLVGL